MTTTSTERITPARVRDAEPSHLIRYKFALKYLAPDHVVLDAPCGVGYGTKLMSSRCAKAHGVDNDVSAIRHAKAHFQTDQVSFYQCNMEDMKGVIPGDSSIDAIVSFEGIEHLHNPELFLREAVRLLKPEGTLIMSTPRKPHGSQYHVREYSLEEYEELLSGYFRINGMFGQIFTEIFNLSKRDVNPHEHRRFNYIALCAPK